MIFASIKNVGIQKLAMALLQQHGRSRTSALLHFFAQWGGLGVLPLAILDSTIIPTFGSLDILTAFLSARHSSLWVYYASMAVTGSMVGSYLTYKLGQKTGLAWFERKFGERRSHQVEYALERWEPEQALFRRVRPPPAPRSWSFFPPGGFATTSPRFWLLVS